MDGQRAVAVPLASEFFSSFFNSLPYGSQGWRDIQMAMDIIAEAGGQPVPEIIVLLVDDVELFLELEKTFLQREGFRILLARNGIEAIALAKEHRPDLVFMSQLQIRLFGPYFSSFLSHSYGYEPANEPKSVLKLPNFRFDPHSPTAS